MNGFLGEVLISTKSHGRTREAVRKDFETSLKELGRDYIDVYQLHLVNNVKELEERRDVLHVPQSALFRSGAQWHVYTVDGGRARVRTVEVGLRNGLEAEIKSGLEVGDAVIATPDAAIVDGSRVRSRL